jgi:hypothetical protein
MYVCIQKIFLIVVLLEETRGGEKAKIIDRE